MNRKFILIFLLPALSFFLISCNETRGIDASKLEAQTQGEIIKRSGTTFTGGSPEKDKLALADAENRLRSGGGLLGKKGLSLGDINNSEKWYPLKVMICSECWLVQTEDFVGVSEMFSEDYSYFSSFSSTWLNHCEQYVNKMLTRFGLTNDSLIVEVASNDGYLLQYVKKAGIPCYGIEPTHSTAEAARDKGIEVVEKFFGVSHCHSLLGAVNGEKESCGKAES